MNRRTFLLAVGASACGPSSSRPPDRAPKPSGGGNGIASSPRTPLTVDTTLFKSQWRASAIALRGDVLVQAAGMELRTYDARTLKRTETRDLVPRHFCYASDGTLVVYSYPRGALEGTVYRIGASRNLETYKAPMLSPDGFTVVLPGRDSQEVYIAVGEQIVPLSIANGRIEDGTRMRHPAPFAQNSAQLVARGDGAIVCPDREPGLRVVRPDGTGTSYPMKGREPRHIVEASGDRIWYSHAPQDTWNMSQLFLAKIATPFAVERALDLWPFRVVHLASGGGAAAALVVHVRPDDRDPKQLTLQITWAVVVVGEDGVERWRAEIPDAFANGNLTSAFVAINEKWVVVSKYDSTLFGWDAATGKPIG